DLADGAEDGPADMVVRFMGLTGPLGALPRHYTELVITRLRRRDHTLAAFLDVFNHRFVSLFFRAWEKYRPHLRYDLDGLDGCPSDLVSVVGGGPGGLRDRVAVRATRLAFYGGILAQRPRSATGLEGLLADYFQGVRVRIEQFVGQWLALDPGSQTSLVPF